MEEVSLTGILGCLKDTMVAGALSAEVRGELVVPATAVDALVPPVNTCASLITSCLTFGVMTRASYADVETEPGATTV